MEKEQESFYKLLSVVFVKSMMHKLESTKWFFVVKNQKQLGARIPKLIL